ncbi:DUF1795 domain-containing protein [Serratia fonticola]|uniref:DUF1795 domain-containing protein n=1 Tax=Serratia fonticola TaxID=47917 RepID=UPI0021796F75|nr:DUF1795 domain-containing protein [Serratia fonticola]CAI1802820.1 Uncharacterized conserved protein [Serratia fonticola]
MKYQIQEGCFSLTNGFEDESINIIKFKELQAALVVTRACLMEGQSLEGYYDQQMAQLKHAMKNFLLDERKKVTVNSPDEQRQSYQVHCEFDQKGQRMYQCLLFTEAQGRLLVMAYSQPRAFSKADFAHWQGIIDSLVLH